MKQLRSGNRGHHVHAVCAALSALLLSAGDCGAATRLAVGADAGSVPRVVVFDGIGGSSVQDFLAFPAAFAGGVRVALGDVDGDGIADLIVGAGAGGMPQVRVFSGANGSVLRDFLGFDAGFADGVYVAAGDVDGDGRIDIVVGAGSGLGHVRIFSGRSGLVTDEYFAFEAGSTGGVRVAAGDVNGDGRADVVASRGAGSSPLVRVYNGRGHGLLREFYAFSQAFTGGVFVATGDIDADGRADLIASADAGAGPQVVAFSGADQHPLASFFAYPANFGGGVRVASADVNGDRIADLVTGPGSGHSPQVNVYPAPTLNTLASFFAFAPSFTNGINVAAPSIADVLLRDGFE